MGATLRRRNYSLAVGSYSGFAVAGKEKAARVPTGGKFAVTPPMPLRDDRRPAARYQIADVVARMVAGRRPTIGAIKSDRAKEKPPLQHAANHQQRLALLSTSFPQQRLLRDTAITTTTNLAGRGINPAAGRSISVVSLKLTRLSVATHSAQQLPHELVFWLFSRNLRNMPQCSPSLSWLGDFSLSQQTFGLWQLPPSRRLNRVPPTPFCAPLNDRYLATLHLLRARCNENTWSPSRQSARLTFSRHIRLVVWADVFVAVTASLPTTPPVSALDALSSVRASLFGFARFARPKALVMRQHLVPPMRRFNFRKIEITQRFRQGRFF